MEQRLGGRGSRFRRFFAIGLIVIASLLTPLAVIGSWAQNELLNTDKFVAALAPLSRDAGMRTALTKQIMAVIDKNVDVPSITSHAVDSITSLGTGSAATLALNALKGPAAAALESLVQAKVEAFVESEAFERVWAKALRVSHAQFVMTMGDNTGTVVSLHDDGVIGIQLGPIVDAARTVLVTQGFTFATRIPTVDRMIPLAQSDNFLTTRTVYRLAAFAGAWLPWLVLVLFAGGIVVSRRRAMATIGVAASVAVAMVMATILLATGRYVFTSTVSPSALTAEARGALFDTLTYSLRTLGGVVLGTAVIAGLTVTLWMLLRGRGDRLRTVWGKIKLKREPSL